MPQVTNEPFPDEQRMYDDQVAGNPNVNETQVRRAGRLADDQRALDELRGGNTAEAGSVQSGETAADRDESDDQNNMTQPTASAKNAAESKSRTGKTQSQRTGAQ